MSNLWIWATVGAAFFQALRYAGLKTLNQSLSTGVTTYVRVFFTLPLLILYLAAVLWWTGEPVPRLSSTFMAYSAASSVAQFAGTLLVVRLFQLGNFAIATLIIKADVIMTALIGTAFFFEHITPVGWAAILVTIVGVVVISLGRQPISAEARGGGAAGILTNAAPTLIGLTSALIYSLSYLFLREAILVADPTSGPFVRSALAAVAMTGISVTLVGVFLLATQPRELLRMFEFQKLCWFIGAASAIASTGWFLASALTNASYVAAVAQVQVVFTLLLSYFYFGERIRPVEIAGVVFIVAGLILFRTA
ncbi:MAG: DMT family transporter [Hyphomicrobiaceae bacterium]